MGRAHQNEAASRQGSLNFRQDWPQSRHPDSDPPLNLADSAPESSGHAMAWGILPIRDLTRPISPRIGKRPWREYCLAAARRKRHGPCRQSADGPSRRIDIGIQGRVARQTRSDALDRRFPRCAGDSNTRWSLLPTGRCVRLADLAAAESRFHSAQCLGRVHAKGPTVARSFQ